MLAAYPSRRVRLAHRRLHVSDVAINTNLAYPTYKPSSSNPPPLWDLNMTHSLWVKQYDWIQQDLIAANKNRDQRPWIVVHGHESLYCSCDEDCDATAAAIRAGPFGNSTYGLEQLLFDQGVDLWLNGHEHNVSLAHDLCSPLFSSPLCLH